MALFKLDWAFPTQESSFAGGEKFLEHLTEEESLQKIRDICHKKRGL